MATPQPAAGQPPCGMGWQRHRPGNLEVLALEVNGPHSRGVGEDPGGTVGDESLGGERVPEASHHADELRGARVSLSGAGRLAKP